MYEMPEWLETHAKLICILTKTIKISEEQNVHCVELMNAITRLYNNITELEKDGPIEEC